MTQEREPRGRFLQRSLGHRACLDTGRRRRGHASGLYRRIPCKARRRRTPVPRSRIRPTYFTEAEWKFVHAAVDHRDTRGPVQRGRHRSRGPEFIDRQMETP